MNLVYLPALKEEANIGVLVKNPTKQYDIFISKVFVSAEGIQQELGR